MRSALIVIALFVGCAVCVNVLPDPERAKLDEAEPQATSPAASTVEELAKQEQGSVEVSDPPREERDLPVRLMALDRLNAASDRANAVMSEINRECARPTGSSYAPMAAYAKCVAGFLVTLCPDIGEGPLIDMSNAARDMDAPVSASLLNQASLDCWNAVYYAETPTGGTLPLFVGEAITQMSEKLSQASARLQ